MRGTYITALVIAVILALWLYSGDHEQELIDGSIADNNRENARVLEDAAPTRVRVAVLEATERAKTIQVRGKTENKRTVMAKAELVGTLVARPVERGTQVQAGDVLCDISPEDRFVSLNEARAELNQARIDYQGALKLKQKGFNSESAIAAARTRLAASEAKVNRRQLDIEKLKVRAPFAGIVEDVHLEIGDYVSPGATCATIVDLDPMLLVGRVSEREVANLTVGQPATGLLSTGQTVEGPITFVGQQSDPATRTYAVEIELPNPEYALRSGVTTEIRIPVDYVLAQKISPALIALDDAGAVGVRTIDGDNRVEFHHIEVLADAADGVWVTGLPNRASVITVGQELVTPGERVDPVFMGTQTMPARTDQQTDPNQSSSESSAGVPAQSTPPLQNTTIAAN